MKGAFDVVFGEDIGEDVQLAKRFVNYGAWMIEPPSFDQALNIINDTITRLQRLRRDQSDLAPFTSTAVHALACSPYLEDVLALVISHAGRSILHVSIPFQKMPSNFPEDAEGARDMLVSLLEAISNVALDRHVVQRAFARGTNSVLSSFVQSRFGTNETDTCCVPQLQNDIARHFYPFFQLLKKFTDPSMWDGFDGALQFWYSQGLEELLRIRPKQMSTILLNRHRYKGAMEDLRWCVAGSTERSVCSTHLKQQLEAAYLLAEKSTVEVLELYMEIIAGLKEVDPTGVILTRVSPPITTFLRHRDDAVKIILASLLEPYDEPKPSTETFCAPIAVAMRAIGGNFYRDYYEGMDITDPNWIPDPIDAGPDHKKSISMDELEHLIHLQSKDVFIGQLQQNLADRLLNTDDASFAQEMALLNLLKTRFTEIQIQQCEIMLSDVVQSQRLDNYIGRAIAQETKHGYPIRPEIHTKVLSQHYWPRLRDDSFVLPGQLFGVTEAYEGEFKRLKRNRRLEWLPALGRVNVELNIDGRLIAEDVTTLQAAVIQPFDEEWEDYETPGTCNIDYLKIILDITEDLLRPAIAFWVHKRIIYESSPDTFTVAESLGETSNGAEGTIASPAVASPGPPPPEDSSLKSAADLLAENAQVYSSFIIGMLTNQGGMPAMRIHMMLRMLVPGGFPFEEAELVAFLQGLAEEAKVERAGANWRIKKS